MINQKAGNINPNCITRLETLERLIKTGGIEITDPSLELITGVDLGTANIVLTVVDSQGNIVTGAMESADVVRDGIVVDYIRAVDIVNRLKALLETRLGRPLRAAGTAIPPGIMTGNTKVICNVVESAGFAVRSVMDEPTAAAASLGITRGAVVDVGGGTTGITILQEGKPIHVVDEPTGGTHMSLVIAGNNRCTVAEAEAYKKDPENAQRVYQMVRPVIERMAEIVQRAIHGYPVDTVYVVGGASLVAHFEEVFQGYLGVTVVQAPVPLLVTPLGIADCAIGGGLHGTGAGETDHRRAV